MAAITQTEAVTRQTLRHTLHPSLQMRIDDLLALLTGVDVASWKARFIKEFLPQLHTEMGTKKASLALCYLIVNIIRPHIVALKGHLAEQKGLARQEIAARSILEALVPGENLLKQYEVGEVARKIQELQVTVRACQEEQFQAMKAKLLQLNANRMKMKEELQARIQQVTTEILALCSSLNRLASEVSQTADALGNYEARFQSLIQECEMLCHEVLGV